MVESTGYLADWASNLIPAVIPPALASELRSKGMLVLLLKVVPKSSRNEIVGLLPDGSLKIKVTAAPEKGRANLMICEYLAAEFGVPKRNVEILRGEASSHKQVRIRAAD